MKRFFALSMALVFSLVLCACAGIPVRTYNGSVVTCGDGVFELACQDGKNYGFVITEDTQLIWEDTGVLEHWEGMEYEEWDLFDCFAAVSVVAGEETVYDDPGIGDCVEGWYYAKKVTVESADDGIYDMAAKPVIYLYPKQETKVEVRLDYDGVLTCTYPAYEGVWQVTASPDGTLTDGRGQQYNYLYWEGLSIWEYDFSQGFCVAGADTAAFLEGALAELGLTRREANEFIVYWLPLMEGNAYNLISFQTEAYTDHAGLTVTPQPDTILRVFMAWYGSEVPVEIPPQTLTAPERTGFVVVEWGGTEVGQ